MSVSPATPGDLEQLLLSFAPPVWDHLQGNTVTGAHHYGAHHPDGHYIRQKAAMPNGLYQLDYADAAQMAKCEEAAWHLAKLMSYDDLIAPCMVMTTTLPRSPAVHVVSRQIEWSGCQPVASLDAVDQHDLFRTAVFDTVILNKDRHKGNMLQEPTSGKLRLIDNATSFFPWPSFKWKLNVIMRFRDTPLTSDMVDALEVVALGLPERVYELLGDGAAGRVHRRVKMLLDAGCITGLVLA
jgi:hypothetical protein